MSVKFVSAILGLEKCVLSAGKPMSIKFLVLGGGGYFGFFGGGGGGVPILFLWARGFFWNFVSEGIRRFSDTKALF